MPHNRREFLRQATRVLAASGAALLGACSKPGSGHWRRRLGLHPGYDGGFVGQHFDRGHLVRAGTRAAPGETRRTDVVIVGAGIAGLAAARRLERASIADYRVFDLEDEAGGNSRGGTVAGYACPWGAHYLPTPGPYAEEVLELLVDYKLCQRTAAGARYDEMQLCHAPQERLYINGGWQDGLLPVRGQLRGTFEVYRRFAQAVRAATVPGAFTIPTARSTWSAHLASLDAQSFDAWLDANGFTTPALRWYLDYCCRDDYGAGSAHVSAWAGLHYFASRHGFSGPEDPAPDLEADTVLTWPEGNGWLARRLAAPLGERLRTGCVALRVEAHGGGVAVDVLDLRSQHVTRWQARRAILATPLFVARRLCAQPSDALVAAAQAVPHAPWLVANLYVEEALDQGAADAPQSWDNVLYDSPHLGYVDAMHQSTRPYAGATVLTWYTALGADPATARRTLLARPWQAWCDVILDDLAKPHPDLASKLRRVEMMRYGHAMAIPAPGVRGNAALAALARQDGVVLHAHSDLSSYSVFEEAFFWGTRAGERCAQTWKA